MVREVDNLCMVAMDLPSKKARAGEILTHLGSEVLRVRVKMISRD